MSLIKAWYHLRGRVWVPPELRHLQEPVILHISDTPAHFYHALTALVRQVRPTWIIHTGDLVDDVKLGLNRRHLNHYTGKVRRLLRILEASRAEAVYLSLGNHDSEAALGVLSPRIRVLPPGHLLKLDSVEIGVAHYAPEAVAAGGDICVFGHNLEQRTDLAGSPQLLNGLEAIYIIRPTSGLVHCLPYPHGTDDQRVGRGKIGL